MDIRSFFKKNTVTAIRQNKQEVEPQTVPVLESGTCAGIVSII